jgi:dynein intermediate chain 2, axonemal
LLSLGLFDVRKGTSPVEQSLLESSHKEPVRNALWLQSKTGTEFFSAAADGIIYWWDTKKMNEPVDKLLFDIEKKGRPQNALAITKLEYDSNIVRYPIEHLFVIINDFVD